jgi:hypothetical protein
MLCSSRPQHHICPTRTSHASYVDHQHNIPYNLKGKPSSTCIQLWHDSSNFLCHQLVGHQQLQTNSITICRWPQKPQMHSTWILPQQQSLNPLWHWKSIFGQTGHAYTRSLQHYQWTTTPNQCIVLIQRLLTSVECINICQLLPFFEYYNWGHKCGTSVIMTLWCTHTSIHDIITKYPKPAKLVTKWLMIQKLQVRLTFKDF